MITHEYPFYLVEDFPVIQVGKHKALVYWGAQLIYSDLKSFEFGGREVELMDLEGERFFRPEFFKDNYGTKVDLVAGWQLLVEHNFTIDLSREMVYLHYIPPHVENKVKLFEDHDYLVPMVVGKIDDTECLFQIDVGDKLSIVHPQLLKGKTPIGRELVYVYEADEEPEEFDIYEIPIKLSDTVTIHTKARPIGVREASDFVIVGTNGSIGVDLIREHAVSFIYGNDGLSMYFSPFGK